MKEEKIIMLLIKENLKNFAEEHNIPVVYDLEHFQPDGKHADSAGYISYHISKFNYTNMYSDFEIFIRSDQSFQWSTLAHELGHYISISNFHDDSEYGADYEARKLILSWLDEDQIKTMNYIFDILFDHKKLKDFTHAKYALGIWHYPEDKEETA